jgi:hypothetical protein
MNLVSLPALSLARAVEAVPVEAERAAGLAGILAAFLEVEVEREIQLELEPGLHVRYTAVEQPTSPMGAERPRKIRRHGSAAEERCYCLWAADAFAVAHKRTVARWYSMVEAIQEWTVSCGMLDSFTTAPRNLLATAGEHISDVVAGYTAPPKFLGPHQTPSQAMCLHWPGSLRSGRTSLDYMRLLSVDEAAEEEQVPPTVGLPRVAAALAIQAATGDLVEVVRT